jgi:flap endonuclease GEN
MMRDIESSLGLHREHLVALALLVGCDYNVHGVSGIGCQNAIRLIKEVPQQQIFDRLFSFFYYVPGLKKCVYTMVI